MPNYDINYDDKRFTKVESEKSAALKDLDKTYDGMISSSDKYYQNQIDASKDWADKQSQLQQDKTDFAIKEIEQNKAQAKKDYLKEQSGAYVDWQKQSNEYGADAEAKAAQGMTNTGYSESSQVSMYNTYQNRVATAREGYNLAIQNYNNSITEARLQNNSVLAEIAYESLQKQLELALQGFQYKNTLILDKADKKTELQNEYYQRYQDVLKQINTENALAEEVRQYNESLAMEKQQLAEEQRQFNEQMAFEREQFDYQKAQAASRSSGGGGGGGGSSRSSSSKSGGTVKGGSSGSGISKSSSGSLPKATAQSLLNLGGPVSPKNVEKQVAEGKVIETKNKNGDTVFKKNTAINVSTNYLSKGVALASTSKKKSDKKWWQFWK